METAMETKAIKQDKYWLLVGRELDKTKLKKLYIMANTGERRTVTPKEFDRFVDTNVVLNAKSISGNLQGVGISLLDLPTYKVVVTTMPNGTSIKKLQNVNNKTEQSVIQRARPLIDKHIQKNRVSNDNQNDDKQKKITYIVNKLMLCNSLLSETLKMKENTNNTVVEKSLHRYLVQIDLDNADNSLRSKIQRQGVLGLAKGISEIIDRCDDRATKFKLNNEDISSYVQYATIDDMIKDLNNKFNKVVELHKLTKELIRKNKQSGDYLDTDKDLESLVKDFNTQYDNAIVKANDRTNFIVQQDGYKLCVISFYKTGEGKYFYNNNLSGGRCNNYRSKSKEEWLNVIKQCIQSSEKTLNKRKQASHTHYPPIIRKILNSNYASKIEVQEYNWYVVEYFTRYAKADGSGYVGGSVELGVTKEGYLIGKKGITIKRTHRSLCEKRFCRDVQEYFKAIKDLERECASYLKNSRQIARTNNETFPKVFL